MAKEHRTYPLGEEVSELRKHRGEPSAEKELHSYGKMREFSKASGTWGKKNSSPHRSKALEKKYGTSRVATAKDRKKNPYLSSDSKVYSDKNGKDYK